MRCSPMTTSDQVWRGRLPGPVSLQGRILQESGEGGYRGEGTRADGRGSVSSSGKQVHVRECVLTHTCAACLHPKP